MANILALVIGGVVLAVVADTLFNHIPLAFKLWLVTPVIAFLAGLYLLSCSVSVWRHAAFDSVWVRLRHTSVTACALFMCWFYYYWNILGWQYKG